MGDSGHLFWTDFSLYWLQILFNHLHEFKKCCTNLKRFAEKYVYIPPLVFIHLSCHLFIRICFSKVCILCQHTGFVIRVTKFLGKNSIDFDMLMHPRFFYIVGRPKIDTFAKNFDGPNYSSITKKTIISVLAFWLRMILDGDLTPALDTVIWACILNYLNDIFF